MEKVKSPFWKNLLVAAVVLIIVIAFGVLFAALKLPFWPFILLLVLNAEVYGLGTEGYWIRCLSGLVGLVLGYSNVLLGFALPTAAVTVFFLIIVLVLLALDIGKNIVVGNAVCMVFFNIVLQVPGVVESENMLPVFLGYILGAVCVAAVIYPLRAAAQRKAEKQETA